MNRIKYFFMVALMMAASVWSANAQRVASGAKGGYPHAFVGIQGGGQTTFTDYNQSKLITPTASVYLGGWFTSVAGARLHVNGLWNKGGFDGNAVNFKYDYKYVTTNLDLLLNLCTLFGNKNWYPVNVNLIGGIGFNYAWDNDDAYAACEYLPLAWAEHRLTHNARVGAQLDFNLSKHWGLNLEVAANSLGDRYNSKVNDRDDWSLTTQLGLTYKFGYKKKIKVSKPHTISSVGSVDKVSTEARAAEPVYATRIDTIWYDDVTYKKEVSGEEKLEKYIYYEIRKSELPDSQTEIDAIADFVKTHRNCKVSVKGYADKGTGTPALNKKYALQRAERATKGLIQAGVDAKIITTESFGDTVQPFAENDRNRVVITVVTGQGTKQEKVVTKRFRTKEVRYQVQ